mmetsp:Transcript_31258/g.67136  ORF Transcript_31258/g.67136 Transcript_31258/m.67136 type:complete len:472 (-) Transcript_31258:741-2156(-)
MVETPSTNFVRKSTFALLNIPSLRETTMNCDCWKCVRIICPIFCVWLKSSAASISSRMYTGAGLKRSKDRTSDSATRDRCPPERSTSEGFHMEPKATLITNPSSTGQPSCLSSLAFVPGSRVEKMAPKSPLTFSQVFRSASIFFCASSSITASILALSFSTVALRSIRSLYSCSAFSNMASTFLLILLASPSSCAVALESSACACCGLRFLKSYVPPATPNCSRSATIHWCFLSSSRSAACADAASLRQRACVCCVCFNSSCASLFLASSSEPCSFRRAISALKPFSFSLAARRSPAAASYASLRASSSAADARTLLSSPGRRACMLERDSSSAATDLRNSSSRSEAVVSACDAACKLLASARASFSAAPMAALDFLRRSSRLPSKSCSCSARESRCCCAALSSVCARSAASCVSASCFCSDSSSTASLCASLALRAVSCSESSCALISCSERSACSCSAFERAASSSAVA